MPTTPGNALGPVHIFRTDPKSKRRILAEVHEFVDVRVDGHGAFVVQNGKIMEPGGREYNPVPDWIKDELDKLSEDHLARIGLNRVPVSESETVSEPVSESEVSNGEAGQKEPASTSSSETENSVPQPTEEKTRRFGNKK